jgi:hypothetical protein
MNKALKGPKESCFEYQDLGGISSVQVGYRKLSSRNSGNSDARTRCRIAGPALSSVHRKPETFQL